MNTFFRYVQSLSRLSIDGWDRFWFALRPTFDIGIARVAFGTLAAVYAASWCIDLRDWIAPNGLLSSSLTRFLIGDQVEGTGSIGRISFLYSFDSPWVTQTYLIVTLLCSLALAFGMGGRFMAAAAWILTLGIVNRVPMLQGAGELLFIAMMGYLVIDPGKTKKWWNVGLDDGAERWSTNLAVRLMQCHVLVWLVVSLVSHLAEPMWWAGSATWWLVSAQLSPWYTQVGLSDKPYLINVLSHAFILMQLITIAQLMTRRGRPLAIVGAFLMAVGIWGLAGDWLYSLALVVSTSPFWGMAVREYRELSKSEDSSTLVVESKDAMQPIAKKNIVKRAVLRSRSKSNS